MLAPIAELLLSQLSGFLFNRIALHFPPERWPDMLRG